LLALEDMSCDVETLKKWHAVDDECPTSALMMDEEIISSGRDDDALSDVESDADGVAAENETTVQNSQPEPQRILPTASQAVDGLQTALLWLETQNVDTVTLMQLRRIVDIAKSRKMQSKKQLTMTHFFTKKAY